MQRTTAIMATAKFTNSVFLSRRRRLRPQFSVSGLSVQARISCGSLHVLYFEIMTVQIRMHDIVALLEETPARHFLTGEPLLLRRGQIGTVVMIYDGGGFEVEFGGRDGRTYAMLPIRADKLMILHETLE